MAQSLPQGLQACQKGHVDPTWPNPLPEAYEHAEWCTSTPDGPPAVPKAHEHGKWPQNNAPTSPGPTSVPNRPRRRHMAHPFPQAFEHAERAQHGPIPSPRRTSTPNVHHNPRWLPNDAAACHKPTRVPNGAQAPQTCPPAAHKGAKRRTTMPDGPSPSPSPTKTQNDARQPDSAPTVPKAHKHTRSPPNGPARSPQPYEHAKQGAHQRQTMHPAFPKAHEHSRWIQNDTAQNGAPPSLRATSMPNGAPTTHIAPNASPTPPPLPLDQAAHPRHP
ncbi:hypothetical protein PAXINDRAFT_16595 [Paxillus involutus ATCC 200175]|uniref:Uncharacterized protein n=1 Tax=Paxillus involutus ATCC 200175 TaxID=664439 RepID=A0A0C9SRD7_PAXIN|nr:hypothetical protein PAXINDRAFT_16595 [Paxillus involutus ATCC 200175]